MGALAHETALVQHEDLVCVQDGGDALCHDEDGGVCRSAAFRARRRAASVLKSRAEKLSSNR